jgi:hypothetical protein
MSCIYIGHEELASWANKEDELSKKRGTINNQVKQKLRKQ